MESIRRAEHVFHRPGGENKYSLPNELSDPLLKRRSIRGTEKSRRGVCVCVKQLGGEKER